MEYEEKDYFSEHEYDDVNGFAVVEVKNGKYHIAEKWFRSGEEDDEPVEITKWIDYWVPESQLLDRVEAGLCEHKAKLTDDQYAAICEKVTHSGVTA